MAAPNVDMIAASLRSCSLGADAAPASPAGGSPASEGGAAGDAQPEAAVDTTVELNSELALPYPWEQCLDLKTGRLYYINRSTGAKATEEPRKFAGFRGSYNSGENKEEEEDDDDGNDADDEGEADDHDDGGSSEGEAAVSESEDSYGKSSSAFLSSSSSASSRDAMDRGPVLVAAGCRACMMYVMISKGAEECPRCRGHVICFGRSGSR